MVSSFWAGVAIGALVILLVVVYIVYRFFKAIWNIL